MLREINRQLYTRDWPIDESVLNVVARRIDEDTVLIPGSTLYSDILMYCAQAVQLPCANCNHCNTRDKLCRASSYKHSWHPLSHKNNNVN